MTPGGSAAVNLALAGVLPVVLAGAAAWHVLVPLWRRAAAGSAGTVERARLVSELEAALRAIHDLTLDHATGKMRDQDFEVLRARQEAAALRALARLDARIEHHPE